MGSVTVNYDISMLGFLDKLKHEGLFAGKIYI